MTAPEQTELPDAEAHAHPGPHDEGGGGGIATRELKAHEEESDER